VGPRGGRRLRRRLSPDNYVIDRESGDVEEVTVADKKMMYVRDGGETVERAVPDEKREQRVLDDDDVDRLVALGERIEDHYETPQDVEWAIYDDDVYLLQSRPITTIDEAIDAPADGNDPSPSKRTPTRRWGADAGLADGGAR